MNILSPTVENFEALQNLPFHPSYPAGSNTNLEEPTNAMQTITLWFAAMLSTASPACNRREVFLVQGAQVASSRGNLATMRLLEVLLRFEAIALLRVQDAKIASSTSISAATRLLKELNAPLEPVDLGSIWKDAALLRLVNRKPRALLRACILSICVSGVL